MEQRKEKQLKFCVQQWTTDKIYETMMQCVAPLPCQAAYARNLASIISMHIHRNQLIEDGVPADELPAPSAIVVAPTGQGKTYLIRKMAEIAGLNVIVIDGSALSKEGWKGNSLSQHLGAAKTAAKDQKHFEESILFIDELDKLRLWGGKNDEGNALTNLLQLFNDGAVTVELDRKTERIPVSRFTVLFGGAFEGLDNIIRERLQPKKIGFGAESGEKLDKAELMPQVKPEDLAKFGLMPELLGRIGSILTIPPLQKEDYRQLLNAEAGSLRLRYNNYLYRLYGVSFEIADSGVERIAQRCMKSSSGARAATPIVNDLMRSAISAVESEHTICRVILDADEDGCCVRYEHGPRRYAYRQPEDVTEAVELPWHTIKANNVRALVRTLCRYHRNAGGAREAVPQMDAFLDCTLTYLHLGCHPREFTFESLEKLARATHRSGGFSPFDIILQDATRVITKEQIRHFDDVYTTWMCQNLTSALQTIMNYIQMHHGACRVRFEVKKQRRPTAWQYGRKSTVLDKNLPSEK